MNEYYVSNSYKNWERIGEPFQKNGKLYTTAKHQCDRCTKGIYAVGVENGHIKPHPAFGGICLKCGGTGYLTKEIRLYTEKEFAAKEASDEKKREKKAAELEERMKREYASNKAKWLEKNNFNAEGETYVITGDSYSIKNKLKEAGFYFNPVLLWHRSSPEGYEDRVIKIKAEEVLEFSAWGEGHYFAEAKEYVAKKVNPEGNDDSNSEWVGEVGDKISRLSVTLVRKAGFMGNWGWSNVYTFKDSKGNVLVWFSQKDIPYDVDDQMLLSGSIKKLDEYKKVKNTVVTRCKLEEA